LGINADVFQEIIGFFEDNNIKTPDDVLTLSTRQTAGFLIALGVLMGIFYYEYNDDGEVINIKAETNEDV